MRRSTRGGRLCLLGIASGHGASCAFLLPRLANSHRACHFLSEVAAFRFRHHTYKHRRHADRAVRENAALIIQVICPGRRASCRQHAHPGAGGGRDRLWVGGSQTTARFPLTATLEAVQGSKGGQPAAGHRTQGRPTQCQAETECPGGRYSHGNRRLPDPLTESWCRVSHANGSNASKWPIRLAWACRLEPRQSQPR